MIWNCLDRVRSTTWLVMWLYDIIITFLLDANSNKYVAFDIIALEGKKLPKLCENWEDNYVYIN